MSWAAFRMKDTIDQYLAGFYTDVIAANMIGTSSSFTTVTAPIQANAGAGTTFYDELVVLGQLLDQQYVPDDGSRFCVIPPWGRTQLSQDVRWTSFNTPQARQAIMNGISEGGGNSNAYLGKIDNMDVYVSVNCPHFSGSTVGVAGAQDAIIAGHPMAITFAAGINKVEAYRPPLRFADAVKGLTLYGAKTLRPYALACAFLQHPA